MMQFSKYMLVAGLAAPALMMAQTADRVRLTSSAAPRASVLAPAADVADSAINQLEGFLGRYPNSPLRPNALFQLGELLVQRADEQFAAQQRGTATASTDTTARASGDTPVRPNYSQAIARYEELVRRFPNFQKIDAAAYTLGTLYSFEQRYADAARMFEIVAKSDSSRFRSEALFRLGDANFELASKLKGDARRAQFAKAAQAYQQATATGQQSNGDIYFLSLYKLGWSYYNQATQTNQAAYDSAVRVFGELVDAYDKLTPEQQARLGLRGEAIEYMAVAFTQVGGAEAANRYFAQHGTDYKLPVLRRVAQSLRDQGDFPKAVSAYETLIAEAPTDSTALASQREIVDIYQNRVLDQPKAQEARLALVEKFGPGSAWAQANPALAAQANQAREAALRQGAQYVLADAQKSGNKQRFAEASSLYERYFSEFNSADSAQIAHTYFAEALFGQGQYLQAGAEFNRAAFGYSGQAAAQPSDSAARSDSSARGTTRSDSTGNRAEAAGRNAIVAFDSAVAHAKGDQAAQDSLFSTVDRFVAAFPNSDVSKKALITKGRRASEAQRWDVMASTFRTYATNYPSDPYTPTAQKLIGDALYKQGQYAEAQVQWEAAANIARQSGRRALADSIVNVRAAAAGIFADTLVKRGEYKRAAEEVYVAYADKNPQSEKAPDALRDAIETYMIVVDSAKAKNIPDDQVQEARSRAIELTNRLVSTYPTYKYRRQYQNLNARLLAESGRKEEAVAALRGIIQATPRGTEQAAAMARLATTLDSLGQKREAAAAYEEFSRAYPSDKQASNAQYNAAVTYLEAGDTASSARAYGTFAQRFPRDERAAQARTLRVGLLQAAGDSAAANVELARLCANPTAELRGTCSSRVAKRYFDQGVATFAAYQAERLVIPTKAQLTAAGVKRASARKQNLLKQLSTQFESAIKTGNPEYLSASTYYLGLAQWEYGNFLKNAQLPESLSDEERQAAVQGATQQAEASYAAARKTWQALIDKADQDENLKNDPQASQWIARARDAVQGNVYNGGTE